MARAKPVARKDEGGPYLIAAILCNDANDRSGAVSIDDIIVTRYLRRPDERFEITVVLIVAPGSFRGSIVVTIDLIHPSGTERGWFREQIAPASTAQWTQAHKIEFDTDQLGTHWFVVKVNDREKTRVPLELAQWIPAPEGRPA